MSFFAPRKGAEDRCSFAERKTALPKQHHKHDNYLSDLPSPRHLPKPGQRLGFWEANGTRKKSSSFSFFAPSRLRLRLLSLCSLFPLSISIR